MATFDTYSSAARDKWPALGKCSKEGICLAPAVADMIEIHLSMGVLKSERKIARWEKQRTEATEKGEARSFRGDLQQDADLADVIRREELYMEDLLRVKELVVQSVCERPAKGKKKAKPEPEPEAPAKGKRRMSTSEKADRAAIMAQMRPEK